MSIQQTEGERMNEEKIKIEVESQLGCPVCGMGRYEEGKPLFQVKREFDLYFARCENCGNYWLTNRMTEEFTSTYYREHYRNLTLPTQEKKDRNLQIEGKRAAFHLAVMKIADIQEKKILEYGSSSGTLLKRLRDEHGCEVLGVEIEPLADDFPIVGSLHEVEEEKYDFLILSHVLEHQNFPIKFLYTIMRKLNPLAHVLIDVPNANADPTAFLLHHPIAFSAQGMQHVFDLLNIEMLAYYPYDWDQSPMHRSQIFLGKL
ncbi:class I SAM-dependent methyltransferase [Candidatus Dojkabacteria bacterium]|nr:class I SAM-dependent methyltransferase [Candidatus Dojkabacteria bacterium]